jgi:hypothetical protein
MAAMNRRPQTNASQDILGGFPLRILSPMV